MRGQGGDSEREAGVASGEDRVGDHSYDYLYFCGRKGRPYLWANPLKPHK